MFNGRVRVTDRGIVHISLNVTINVSGAVTDSASLMLLLLFIIC